jgi:hypothetical protein
LHVFLCTCAHIALILLHHQKSKHQRNDNTIIIAIK